jgi:hypothetical protein
LRPTGERVLGDPDSRSLPRRRRQVVLPCSPRRLDVAVTLAHVLQNSFAGTRDSRPATFLNVSQAGLCPPIGGARNQIATSARLAWGASCVEELPILPAKGRRFTFNPVDTVGRQGRVGAARHLRACKVRRIAVARPVALERFDTIAVPIERAVARVRDNGVVRLIRVSARIDITTISVVVDIGAIETGRTGGNAQRRRA